MVLVYRMDGPEGLTRMAEPALVQVSVSWQNWSRPPRGVGSQFQTCVNNIIHYRTVQGCPEGFRLGYLPLPPRVQSSIN